MYQEIIDWYCELAYGHSDGCLISLNFQGNDHEQNSTRIDKNRQLDTNRRSYQISKKSILRDAFFIYWTAYERLPQSKHFLILSL